MLRFQIFFSPLTIIDTLFITPPFDGAIFAMPYHYFSLMLPLFHYFFFSCRVAAAIAASMPPCR